MSSTSSRPVWLATALALILFCSGLCALIYQTVWLREFRLIFGGAAPAAAAVLAVFMGGLGLGSWWFGRLVERVRFPFRFYARLEIAIAVAAMVTPYLLKAVRALYLWTGGAQALGSAGATLAQILMTLLVLGIPCFLMGGTLPAAMKFAQRDDDPRRAATAFFYAINVAGAVCGVAMGTFWLLGTVGNQATLTLAGLVNAGLAGAAWLISNACERVATAPASTPFLNPQVTEAAQQIERRAPARFVLAAAFVSGFTFFVIELLWYRISAPLLGGSVYSFGLVLGVALAGIGIGGLLYSVLLRNREPSVEGFVLVSALQAVSIILPGALGDNYAFASLVINDLTRGFGFGPLVAGWATITGGLVFVPSLLAGMQFPMLVSLLGKGNAGVGQELGRAYLWNTAGAILGSLLGGFVLIPLLGLRRCWYMDAALIGLMPVAGLVLLNYQGRQKGGVPNYRRWQVRTAGVVLVLGIIAVLQSTGPTSVWFHFPIGYGRTLSVPRTPEQLQEWKRTVRRSHVQSFDGRETSVAVMSNDEYILLTNGKADGSALGDAATQVMLGLTGPALHPGTPKRACVIGLGTGTTVGWLADVPGMEHVDSIEIEERMQDLAKLFSPVNRNAMIKANVREIVGDAREFLATPGEKYDIIVSEPSNPFRAGVASLYTREFYHSVHDRLNEDGILCQWVQGYEATPESIEMVLGTMSQEFPKVELWNTFENDLLIVASPSDQPWNVEKLRARLKQEPFAGGVRRVWYTDSAEGFLAHCLANQDYTQGLQGAHLVVNTDDLNLLEFSYAKTLGKTNFRNAYAVRQRAYGKDQMLPKVTGRLDEEMMGRELLSCLRSCSRRVELFLPNRGKAPPPAVNRMRDALEADAANKPEAFEQICAEVPPRTIEERWLLAVSRANRGAQEANAALADMEPLFPENVSLLRARLAYVRKDYPTARRAFIAACEGLHRHAWVDLSLLEQTLALAEPLSSGTSTRAATEDARALYQALRQPFLVGAGDDMRLNMLTAVSGHTDDQTRLDMVAAWGPHFPWRGLPLTLRASAFMNTGDQRLGQAMEDFQEFLEGGGEAPKPKAAPPPQAARAAPAAPGKP